VIVIERDGKQVGDEKVRGWNRSGPAHPGDRTIGGRRNVEPR
jgi:hypothetical protein